MGAYRALSGGVILYGGSEDPECLQLDRLGGCGADEEGVQRPPHLELLEIYSVWSVDRTWANNQMQVLTI